MGGLLLLLDQLEKKKKLHPPSWRLPLLLLLLSEGPAGGEKKRLNYVKNVKMCLIYLYIYIYIVCYKESFTLLLDYSDYWYFLFDFYCLLAFRRLCSLLLCLPTLYLILFKGDK